MTEDPRIISATPMEMRLRTISAQIAPAEERKILRLMFLMIKDMPHQWDKDHPDFGPVGGRLKRKKKREVRMLTKLYRKYDRHATLCTVKRKLSALVSSYIQERRKVKLEQYIDPNGPIREYQSSLWQYEDLSFMDDSIDVSEAMVDEHLRSRTSEEDGSAQVAYNNKQKVASHSSLANSSSEPNSATQNVVQSNVHLKSDNITNVYLKTKRNAVYEPNKFVRENTDTNDELEPISDNNEEPEDSSSLFMKQDGVKAIEKFVNFKLNHVDKEQMVIAQKLIFEVLQHAQSGNLTHDSFIQMGLEKTSHTE